MNNTENPTLIAGFEDFISYIKNQDARIKTLEKENKELKKGWSELIAEIENMKQEYYTETGENWKSE